MNYFTLEYSAVNTHNSPKYHLTYPVTINKRNFLKMFSRQEQGQDTTVHKNIAPT